VALAADVYRPEGDGPFPVLLRRTPYGKQLNDLAADPNEAQLFASHGYVVVTQDTRGRFASGGVFYPFVHEPEDGYDTVESAASAVSCRSSAICSGTRPTARTGGVVTPDAGWRASPSRCCTSAPGTTSSRRTRWPCTKGSGRGPPTPPPARVRCS